MAATNAMPHTHFFRRCDGCKMGKSMRKSLAFVFAFVCGMLFAREIPPKLQIDVDFFDNLSLVRPYCGSNWIERFFADCKAHGVGRVVWRCSSEVANYPTKLNYTVDAVQQIKSAADERRYSGAFAAKVGVGRLPDGKPFGGIKGYAFVTPYVLHCFWSNKDGGDQFECYLCG